MRRPTGVIILSILYWLAASGLFMLGIAMAVGLTIFGKVATGVPAIAASLGVIGGIVVLGFAAAMAFIGYGLYQMFEWARITTIVIAALGLAGGIFGFLHPYVVSRFASVVRMALDGFIIWYLVQPQVVAVFRRA